jgi:hypothetical protein
VNDGHKWTHPAPGVPWARYDALGRRLPDTPEAYLRDVGRKVLIYRFIGYTLTLVLLVLLSRS